ncbi:FAD-dependent oxidoreductase [Streptomyces capparidis]
MAFATSSRSAARPRPAAHRTVVVGGGVAGARLVHQLAAYGRGDDVVWLGEERHPAYNRVLLAEVLAGRYPAEVIELPAAPCEVRRGVRVTRIDRERAEVECADGERIGYGTLVLATGSNPVLGPLRGLPPAGVYPFRSLDDCLALDAEVRPGTRAVVVGGGLLGVSAARALAARGASVVVAHQGEHLMDRFLDARAGALLKDHLTAFGVEVHTECRVRGLRTDGGERVSAVELADGYLLETDVAVLACGVAPRTKLALDAGLTVRRGVVVDDELRTDDPRIRAVGDCAEHRGVVYGLAGAAREQADALAALLAGRPAAYRGTRALTRLTLNAGGAAGPGPLDIASFGVTDEGPEDEVLRLADATRGAYRKVVVRDNRLVGGILFGDLATVGTLARTWEGDEPLPAQPLHLLTTGAAAGTRLTTDGGAQR